MKSIKRPAAATVQYLVLGLVELQRRLDCYSALVGVQPQGQGLVRKRDQTLQCGLAHSNLESQAPLAPAKVAAPLLKASAPPSA